MTALTARQSAAHTTEEALWRCIITSRSLPRRSSPSGWSNSLWRTQAEEDTPVPSPGECSRAPACALSPPADSVRSAFDLVSSTALSATPLRTALRHVVRCDEYKPSRRRSRPTSPGSVHRSASSTTRSLYDGLNRRRVGLSTTSASGAAAALRLPSQVSGAIPFSSILSRCLSILGFSAFALL